MHTCQSVGDLVKTGCVGVTQLVLAHQIAPPGIKDKRLLFNRQVILQASFWQLVIYILHVSNTNYLLRHDSESYSETGINPEIVTYRCFKFNAIFILVSFQWTECDRKTEASACTQHYGLWVKGSEEPAVGVAEIGK